MLEVVFWLYLFGYMGLTLALVVVLWANPTALSVDLNFWALGATSPAWRFAALVLFCSLAGLPPFFFFLCKLSVLVMLLNLGALGSLILALTLLLAGWYVYQSALLRSSLWGFATPTSPSKRVAGQSPASVALLALVVVGLAGGGLFFDDLIVLCMWFSL